MPCGCLKKSSLNKVIQLIHTIYSGRKSPPDDHFFHLPMRLELYREIIPYLIEVSEEGRFDFVAEFNPQ